MSSKKSKSRGDNMSEVEYRNEVVMPALYKSMADNLDKRRQEMAELKKRGIRGRNFREILNGYRNVIKSINSDINSYGDLYDKLIDTIKKTLRKAMDDGVDPTDHKKLKSIVDKVIKDDLTKIPNPGKKEQTPTPATKTTPSTDIKAKGRELLKRLEAVVKAEKRVIKETKDDDDFDESLYWTPEEVAEVKDAINEAVTMDDLEEAKDILKSQESDIKVHETEVGIEYKPPVVKTTSDKASKAREAKVAKAEEKKDKDR